MKNHLFLLFSLSFIASCAPTRLFQLCTTTSEDATIVNEHIVFEDTNCKILYNFWEEGGEMEALIFNKTDSDIVFDLRKSFLVINNLSNAYYPNLIGSKAGNPCCSDMSEATIPPTSMVKLPEIKLLQSRFIICEISDHPKKKERQSIQFGLDNSPFVFYNILTYRTAGQTNRIENHFYLSEIVNMPYAASFKTVYTDECGRSLGVGNTRTVYTEYGPNKFYFEYLYRYN